MDDKDEKKAGGWRDHQRYHPEEGWWWKWVWAAIVFIVGALLLMADYKG